jgi:nitrate reductase alpha subunit
MTESMTRKAYFGQTIGKGFEVDVHSPSGAPKEAFVKVEKAEDGGLGGDGEWRPSALGFRPGSPSAAMEAYIAGRFTTKKER